MKNHQTVETTVTVAIVIFRMASAGLEVLLIKQGTQPHQGKLALPGGKLNADDPSLEQAILREVHEETGLTIPAKHLQQVGIYGNIGRDPRGRYVSVPYTLTEMVPASFQARVGDDASAVGWFPPNVDGPTLAFDHSQMIEDAIQYLHGCCPETDTPALNPAFWDTVS